jgi:hypothetical protein
MVTCFKSCFPGTQRYEYFPEKEIFIKKKDQSYIGASSITIWWLFLLCFFRSKLGTVAFSVLTMIQSFVFIDLWLSHRHIHENFKHSTVIFHFSWLVQFIILTTISAEYLVQPVSTKFILNLSYLILALTEY